MRRSIQDLVSSIDPNVKIEPEVEDVRTVRFNCLQRLELSLVTFRYCRRVHRLCHEFWVPACETSRRRHARSERSPASSRYVSPSLRFLLQDGSNSADSSERNHNIRIPGFASDETRISMSQTTIAPALPSLTQKKGATSNQVTMRSHRLAQVAQAKREAKLM